MLVTLAPKGPAGQHETPINIVVTWRSYTTAIASEDPHQCYANNRQRDEGGLGGEKEKDPEAADKRLLSKYTDPTENFVTDAFCAQMLSDDMDPDHGRQVIQNLREALQRKRERELAEARARKGGAKGKRKLQFVGQVIGKLKKCLVT